MSTYFFERTLSRGTQFSLDETPIVNGKVRLTTDTKRLFFDVNDNRFEITDFISEYTEDQILNSIENPLPKFYLAKDTFKLFKWDKINNVWNTICDSVSEAEHAVNSDNATNAENDEDGNRIKSTYAKLNSPNLTGNPTAPKATGSDINSVANVGYVSSYVAAQLAALKNGMIVIVNRYSDLPSVGESGKIYLVPSSSTSSKNRYEEYIWSTTLNDYEKFGTTDINLDGYINSINVSGGGNAVTKVEVDSSNTSQLNIKKESTFLTQHPTINRTTNSREESPVYGAKFDVVESLNMDNNGHITGYNTKKVTMVSNVNHANNADYATSAGGVNWSNVNNRPSKLSNFTNDTNFITANDLVQNASTAQVAIKDSDGENITNKYVESITNIGNKLRYKKGDDSNIDITVNFATNSNTAEYAKNANKSNSADNATNAMTAVYAQTSGSSLADVSWDAITGKPSTYTPSSHNHTTVNITGLTNTIKATKVDNATNADTATYANSAKYDNENHTISEYYLNSTTVPFVKNIEGINYDSTSDVSSFSYSFNDSSYEYTEERSGYPYQSDIINCYRIASNSVKNAASSMYAVNAGVAETADIAYKANKIRSTSISNIPDWFKNVEFTATDSGYIFNNHVFANNINKMVILNGILYNQSSGYVSHRFHSIFMITMHLGVNGEIIGPTFVPLDNHTGHIIEGSNTEYLYPLEDEGSNFVTVKMNFSSNAGIKATLEIYGSSSAPTLKGKAQCTMYDFNIPS